jgi:hypothetical protein
VYVRAPDTPDEWPAPYVWGAKAHFTACYRYLRFIFIDTILALNLVYRHDTIRSVAKTNHQC